MKNAMKTALFAIVATALQASAWTAGELCEIVTNQLLYACGEVDRNSFLESAARRNPDAVSEALMRLATNGMASTDPVARDAYPFALWMMGDCCGTNAIPFLLERISAEHEEHVLDSAIHSFRNAAAGDTNTLRLLVGIVDDGRQNDKILIRSLFDSILHVEPDLDLPEEKRAAYVAFVEENAFKYDVSPDFDWADKFLCRYRPGWTESTNRLAVANRIVALPDAHPADKAYFTAVISSFEPLRGGENEGNGGSPGLPPPREGEPAHLPETFKTLQGGPK